MTVETTAAGPLEIAYVDEGPRDGWPVVLSHGFPYDVRAYDAVVPILVRGGARVVRPYLRGFGSTRFRSGATLRSGQQGALGRDVIDLLDALGIDRAILGGYDWGGLASCVATAIWPERVAGLVALGSYDVIDVAQQRRGDDPHVERKYWYRHLFQTERGRDCLSRYRRELCRMLWHEWSPDWRFDDATFDATAASFDNPDFVDVVLHAYRFHFGFAEGDPDLAAVEARLATRPKIGVPAVTLDGLSDTIDPRTADQAGMFTGRHEHRDVASGHNLPQEAPEAFADAILTVRGFGAV